MEHGGNKAAKRGFRGEGDQSTICQGSNGVQRRGGMSRHKGRVTRRVGLEPGTEGVSMERAPTSDGVEGKLSAISVQWTQRPHDSNA